MAGHSKSSWGKRSHAHWEETISDVLKVTESLKSLSIIRALSPNLRTTDPTAQNTQNTYLDPEKIKIDGIEQTYLPRRAPPTLYPPRLDIKRLPGTGKEMASVLILQDSLKYYGKAQEIYEKNCHIRQKLLAINADTPQIGNSSSYGPEQEEDPFFEFMAQIIRLISKLLSMETPSHFDKSLTSMLEKLDIDEGFFLISLSKVHQGGELYEFLVATRRVLGEYRMMQCYHVWTPEKLAQFLKEKLGKYADLRSKTNWNKVWMAIGEERKLLSEYKKEFEDYYDDIESTRHLRSIGFSVETFLPPEKPYTPYVDDIISASNDTGIIHEYLVKEILFLAEELTTGENFIRYALMTKDLTYLSLRFEVDLAGLKIIYHGHSKPEMFFQVRNRIERFRDLLFDRDKKGYTAKSDWYIAGAKLLDIFDIPDAERRLQELDNFLEDPTILARLKEQLGLIAGSVGNRSYDEDIDFEDGDQEGVDSLALSPVDL
ncbi:hypothetical protein TWF730_007296 [Orbilia blumenaviensis]|uniref:Uncharacterized protein n=1 Tax=Orbilia blumenaviensis TaxID=1796055 RepID=A0AAV9VDT0_9PEZI